MQMKSFFISLNKSILSFTKEEKGAQVVEYALIIAVVSIGLVLALASATDGGIKGSFSALVTRITNCFNGTACTAP